MFFKHNLAFSSVDYLHIFDNPLSPLYKKINRYLQSTLISSASDDFDSGDGLRFGMEVSRDFGLVSSDLLAFGDEVREPVAFSFSSESESFSFFSALISTELSLLASEELSVILISEPGLVLESGLSATVNALMCGGAVWFVMAFV